MARAEVLHWTPRDYLADYKTQGLTLEEHGAYSLLLWNMWAGSESQSEFPLDYHFLASIWRCPPEEAERLVDRLTTGPTAVVRIKETKTGVFLTSKRLQQQKEQADIARNKKVAGGIASGVARRKDTPNIVRTAFDSCSNTQRTEDELTYLVSRNTYLVARSCSHTQVIEEIQEAYHDKRWREQSALEIMRFLADNGDPDKLLSAVKRVPPSHNQSLTYLIRDGVWKKFVPRRKPKPCTNPACVSGHIITDAGAVPCPDCNGGAS